MHDTVFISNLCVHGYHGVFQEERSIGQKFHIDIECNVKKRNYNTPDAYNTVVCYGEICSLVQSVSDAGPYQLIETLANKIAETILQNQPLIDKVRLRIQKPSAPVKAVFDAVGVEVERARDG
jgi:dihydroneopterin aldolase